MKKESQIAMYTNQQLEIYNKHFMLIVAKLMKMVLNERVNQAQVFESVDMLNLDPSSFYQIIQFFVQTFSMKSKHIRISIDIFDIFMKNSQISFHFACNNKIFQQKLLDLLKFRRKKAWALQGVRSNKQNWNYIEEKVLYIIQLWYDTFMLQQSRFSNIIQSYKRLRAEGLQFPARQIGQQNMINVKVYSPIFQNIASICSSQKKSTVQAKRPTQEVKSLPQFLLQQNLAVLMSLGDQLQLAVKKESVNQVLFSKIIQIKQSLIKHVNSHHIQQKQSQNFRYIIGKIDSKIQTYLRFKARQDEKKQIDFFKQRDSQLKTSNLNDFRSMFSQALETSTIKPEVKVATRKEQDNLLLL